MAGMTSNGNNQSVERVLYEVKKVIVGQDHLLERMVAALLSQGPYSRGGRALAWPRPWQSRPSPKPSEASFNGSSSLRT